MKFNRFRSDRRLHVVVLGDAMLDVYLRGSASRLAREAPVPVVDLEAVEARPGGAANTALNAAALGVAVSFVSVIGDDEDGRMLRGLLTDGGVGCEPLLSAPDRSTITKRRITAGVQQLVRLDQGSTSPLPVNLEDELTECLVMAASSADAVLVSDYAYGILTPRVIATLDRLRIPLLAVDARNLARYHDLHPTIVKPNYEEALGLLGLTDMRGRQARTLQIASQRSALLAITGAQMVAATLDADGALLLQDHDVPVYRTYAEPIQSPATAGAGDSFVAALTIALAGGAAPFEAMEIASAAASVVVRKAVTDVCQLAELERQLAGESKTVLPPDVSSRLAELRHSGRRVVFTNGCFDLLHRGHVTYLNRAKALGDVLVVGVNADESVRRLKGQNRPINTLEDRMQVLAGLSAVDVIVPFEDDTPTALIEALRPDVFVKGGDYSHATLPEAALVESFGGTVQILPFVEDHSTTGMIDRIVARGGKLSA